VTDTPIIDAVVRAGCNKGCNYPDCEPACHPHALRMRRALREALPWEPSAEAVEAMAYARTSPYLPIKSEYTDAARIYRAQPIMRELYPEKFP